MQPPFYNNAEMYKKGGSKMDWSVWIDKVHPIRAILALSSLAATVYFLVVGVVIPDAWWIIVTALCLFYVEAFKSTPAS